MSGDRFNQAFGNEKEKEEKDPKYKTVLEIFDGYWKKLFLV